jgi:PAP2 superfamily
VSPSTATVIGPQPATWATILSSAPAAADGPTGTTGRTGRTGPAGGGATLRLSRLFRQVLGMGLAVVAYLTVRRLTEGDHGTAEAHARALLDFERSVGLDWEAGAQDLVLGTRPLVHAFNFVYVWLFWPFVIAALAILYRRDHRHFASFRNALFVSGAVGLVVFAFFPVAPPRFLDGFTDTVSAFSSQQSVAHPSSFTNEYAAMPSFHVGWTVLAGVCLGRLTRRRWLRITALAPGALMAVTVVLTANHYVVDAVAGTMVALGGLALTETARRRTARLCNPAVVTADCSWATPGGSSCSAAA